MKNTSFGILLVTVVALILLLFTCAGPFSEDAGGSNDSSAVASAEPTPTQTSRDQPDPSGGTERAPTHPADDRPSTGSQAPTSTASGSTMERERSLPPEVSSLPAESIPTDGIDALMAVHPRDLEDGSGSSAMLVSVDSLRDRFRIQIDMDGGGLPTDYTRGQPSSTINTPTAYGQQFGTVYGGVGYQERIRYDDWNDGVAVFGVGLGDPVEYVGLDVSVSILDAYTEFAKDRSLTLKLHRRLPYRSSIAVGHENLWHTDGTDGGSSRYVVLSKVLLFRDRPTSALGSMVVNVGLGNDRFLPEHQFVRGDDGVNAFGSVAVRVLPPVNAVANWTGQDLALGLSIAPVRTWPLVITPAVVDLTGRAGDGPRFSVSVGLSYRIWQ